MRQALEVFDQQGELITLTSRQGEIDAIVQVMDALHGAQLHQELGSFTAGLAGYWGSYQRVEQRSQACLTRYPRAVVQARARVAIDEASHQQQNLRDAAAFGTRGGGLLCRRCNLAARRR